MGADILKIFGGGGRHHFTPGDHRSYIIAGITHIYSPDEWTTG